MDDGDSDRHYQNAWRPASPNQQKVEEDKPQQRLQMHGLPMKPPAQDPAAFDMGDKDEMHAPGRPRFRGAIQTSERSGGFFDGPPPRGGAAGRARRGSYSQSQGSHMDRDRDADGDTSMHSEPATFYQPSNPRDQPRPEMPRGNSLLDRLSLQEGELPLDMPSATPSLRDRVVPSKRIREDMMEPVIQNDPEIAGMTAASTWGVDYLASQGRLAGGEDAGENYPKNKRRRNNKPRRGRGRA